jgi:uncharacterized repeat protein (TIGR03803 family)
VVRRRPRSARRAPYRSAWPEAGLVDAGGTLYGTTSQGGGYDGGVLFSITPSGSMKLVHTFHGGASDGARPYAPLIDMKGTLYGTTEGGGQYNCIYHGCGTVFSITPSGSLTVLHGFGASGDGAFPVAGLIDVGGTLYGTTKSGGSDRLGTAFAITP